MAQDRGHAVVVRIAVDDAVAICRRTSDTTHAHKIAPHSQRTTTASPCAATTAGRADANRDAHTQTDTDARADADASKTIGRHD